MGLRAPPQGQALGPPVREDEAGPGHHGIRVPGHPVGQVTEGIGHELDIRVEDEVVGAGKLRQDGVVAGAKAAVLFAAAHLDLLPGPRSQQTLPHGLFQPGPLPSGLALSTR